MASPVETRHNFWDELDQPEQSALVTVGRPAHYGHGKAIIDHAVVSDGVVVIRRGFAKVVTRVPSGPEVVLAVRGPGDVIGELAGIGGGDPSASVAAIGPVEGLLIDYDSFSDVLSRYPHAAASLQRTLVNKLREADRDRLAVGFMTVGQRLARRLLILAGRYGVPTAAGGVSIGLALSQRDLASYVSGSPRTVARQLEQWRQRRIIVTGRRNVIIMRPHELTHIAGPSAPP